MLSISWAYFAEESSENRHAKVQRPFFTAGCFALSDNFAGVMLEMLVHMMNLSGTLATIRMCYLVAEENYQFAMLVSFSKLVTDQQAWFSKLCNWIIHRRLCFVFQ